jgi:hypothetical protein
MTRTSVSGRASVRCTGAVSRLGLPEDPAEQLVEDRGLEDCPVDHAPLSVWRKATRQRPGGACSFEGRRLGNGRGAAATSAIEGLSQRSRREPGSG